ncbi:hypothetical protein BG003_003492, partial [Podila horticola]
RMKMNWFATITLARPVWGHIASMHPQNRYSLAAIVLAVAPRSHISTTPHRNSCCLRLPLPRAQPMLLAMAGVRTATPAMLPPAPRARKRRPRPG